MTAPRHMRDVNDTSPVHVHPEDEIPRWRRVAPVLASLTVITVIVGAWFIGIGGVLAPYAPLPAPAEPTPGITYTIQPAQP